MERMVAQKFGFGLANSANRREVRNNCLGFQGGISPQRNYSGRAAIWPVWDIMTASDPLARPNRASWNGMQFDRSETNALHQVDDDELPSALGKRQGEDQPVRSGRHRLDASAARNVDRRGGELMSSRGVGSAARYPTGNDRDQSCKTDDEHHAHHDNQDLERTHGTRARSESNQFYSLSSLFETLRAVKHQPRHNRRSP